MDNMDNLFGNSYIKKAEIPINIVKDEYNTYIAWFNEEAYKFLPERLCKGCVESDISEDLTIKNLFLSLKILYDYKEDCALRYQRLVPFICGDWKFSGGWWFTVFGLSFYFRYGKQNKGGFFIPFTKLNIQITNYWKIYKKYKDEKNSLR